MAYIDRGELHHMPLGFALGVPVIDVDAERAPLLPAPKITYLLLLLLRKALRPRAQLNIQRGTARAWEGMLINVLKYT